MALNPTPNTNQYASDNFRKNNLLGSDVFVRIVRIDYYDSSYLIFNKQKRIKMRIFFDRIGAICIGLFVLFLIEGLISFGMFLKFEEYNTLAWAMQGMAVYLTCWASIRIQEAQ